MMRRTWLLALAGLAGCATMGVKSNNDAAGKRDPIPFDAAAGPPIEAALGGVIPAIGLTNSHKATGDLALFAASPAAVVDGRRYPLRIDSNRGLILGAGTATVGTFTLGASSAAIGAVDTELAAAAALADNAANPTTAMAGANLMAYDGATWDRVMNGNGVAATAVRVSIASDSTGQVALAAGTASIGSVGAIVNALPAGTNNIGDVDILTFPDNEPINVAQIGGAAVTAGAGAVAAGTPRVTLASDDPAVTALQVIDDWDETNRAAVNVIAGQAGIAGGTGVDGATVPRVTLATNVGLPAGANNIGDVDVLTVNGVAPAFGAGVVGATVQRVTVSTDDVVSIDDNAASLTVDNATLAVVGAGAGATALRVAPSTDATFLAEGEIARDAAVTTVQPVLGGGRASTAKPTGMSGDGDLVDIWTSRAGSVRTISGEVAYVTSTTFGADLAAVGANTGNRLVVVTVRELSGAAARVMVRHGTADTGTLVAAVSLAANGAETITFAGGINADSGIFLDWITGSMEVTVGTEDHE